MPIPISIDVPIGMSIPVDMPIPILPRLTSAHISTTTTSLALVLLRGHGGLGGVDLLGCLSTCEYVKMGEAGYGL